MNIYSPDDLSQMTLDEFFHGALALAQQMSPGLRDALRNAPNPHTSEESRSRLRSALKDFASGGKTRDVFEVLLEDHP